MLVFGAVARSYVVCSCVCVCWADVLDSASWAQLTKIQEIYF